ncbi:MAG: hypothetical protein QN720_10500 [Nitrososphaeraceae archaeon]|nr:hypothetical protein [Nitrososphaeraceae archaeon]MDW0316178.1 hypothetical protein [Nitrososphaeraceae archaeon]
MLKKEGFLSLYPEIAPSAARSFRIKTIYYNTNVLKVRQSFETRFGDQPK